MPERLVVVLAFDQANLIDIAGPLQAFDTANRLGAPTYRLVTASAEGGPVATAPGLAVLTTALSDIDPASIDTLIVPGGATAVEGECTAPLSAWLAANGHAVSRLCSVCTGAFVLARSGVLDGRRVTTHWSRSQRLQESHPAIHVDADRLVIRDGRYWTSGGVTTGIDLSLALISADLGDAVSVATARQLVVFANRQGGQNQFTAPKTLLPSRADGFESLHDWIGANLSSNLSVERLAEIAGMSARNFARVYASATGTTPAKAVEGMRIEAACRALVETELPVKAIAARTGLVSEQNLRRVLHRQFGIAPSEYRARFGKRVAQPA